MRGQITEEVGDARRKSMMRFCQPTDSGTVINSGRYHGSMTTKVPLPAELGGSMNFDESNMS